MDKLKVGNMFFVKIKDILRIYISNPSIEKYRKYNPLTDQKFPLGFELTSLAYYQPAIDILDKINENLRFDAFTIIKYLGEGKFLEYFTNLIFLYEDSELIKKIKDSQLKTWEDFMNIYQSILDYSLVIKSESLIEVEDYSKTDFIVPLNKRYDADNKTYIDNTKYIREAILEFYHNRIEDNNLLLKTYTKEDETYAYVENIIREFEMRNEENVTRTLKKDAFDTALEGSKIFLKAQGFIKK